MLNSLWGDLKEMRNIKNINPDEYDKVIDNFANSAWESRVDELRKIDRKDYEAQGSFFDRKDLEKLSTSGPQTTIQLGDGEDLSIPAITHIQSLFS